MSNYDDMLRAWGLALAEKNGFGVSGLEPSDENVRVLVDFKSEWSGYCETCAYETEYLIIQLAVGSRVVFSQRFNTNGIENLLAEVMEFAATDELAEGR